MKRPNTTVSLARPSLYAWESVIPGILRRERDLIQDVEQRTEIAELRLRRLKVDKGLLVAGGRTGGDYNMNCGATVSKGSVPLFPRRYIHRKF
jgi:hypothetical protein